MAKDKDLSRLSSDRRTSWALANRLCNTACTAVSVKGKMRIRILNEMLVHGSDATECLILSHSQGKRVGVPKRLARITTLTAWF
jgi:hypothetical protein